MRINPLAFKSIGEDGRLHIVRISPRTRRRNIFKSDRVLSVSGIIVAVKSSFSRNSRSSSRQLIYASLSLSRPLNDIYVRPAGRPEIDTPPREIRHAKPLQAGVVRASRQFPTTIPSRGPRAVFRSPLRASRIPPGRPVSRARKTTSPSLAAQYCTRVVISLSSREAADEWRKKITITWSRHMPSPCEPLPSPPTLDPKTAGSTNTTRDYVTPRSKDDRRNYVASRASEIAPRTGGTRINWVEMKIWERDDRVIGAHLYWRSAMSTSRDRRPKVSRPARCRTLETSSKQT